MTIITLMVATGVHVVLGEEQIVGIIIMLGAVMDTTTTITHIITHGMGLAIITTIQIIIIIITVIMIIITQVHTVHRLGEEVIAIIPLM